MVLSHRRLIGASICVALMGVGLIVAAFATDHWIDSDPKNNTETVDKNGTGGSVSKYTANVTFGLFTGYKSIDFSLGARQKNLEISCDVSENACAFVATDSTLDELIQAYKNQTRGDNKNGITKGDKSMKWFGLFSFAMYVTTIVMLVIAILWGFVAIGFGFFNAFGRPIETITGPSGLYLWNLLAALFTTVAIAVYLGLYFSQLRVNILTKAELDTGFTSEDCTYLDYSFYFVVGAAFLFLLNLAVLFISGQKCSCNYSRSGEKEVDSGMILY